MFSFLTDVSLYSICMCVCISILLNYKIHRKERARFLCNNLQNIYSIYSFFLLSLSMF
jgi:hypothetical protein